MSRAAFEAGFPDDEACGRYLVERRWPDGFVCPRCRGRKGWRLQRARPTFQCAGCRRQTSVTAGTLMHRSHLPLRTWFIAVHIVTSHANGISALQLQAQLGLGSYETAWFLLQRLRRAMVDPARQLLQDVVEIDETEIPLRSKPDPIDGGRGRSAVAKMLVAGAVELSPEAQPRRIRLAPIADFSAPTLTAFVDAAAAPGAKVITDGWKGYADLPRHEHRPRTVGKMAAHVVMKQVHRVVSNLKRWALGTFHGLRRKHLRRYLDEYVFRWNRRRHTRAAFDTLLGLAARLPPATYRDVVDQHV